MEAFDAYNSREARSSNGIELYGLVAGEDSLVNRVSLETATPVPTFLDTEQIRNHIKDLFGHSESRPDSTERQSRARPSHPSKIGPSKKIESSLERAITLLEIMKRSQRLKIRPARESDTAGLVEVDITAFRSVYKHYDISPQELKDNLLEKFSQRFDRIGRKWVTVLEKDHKIVGFITACPTSKRPEDFISWEDTTDNGTLQSTYDPDGGYLYAVSLSVLPEASRIGGQDMLMVNLISKIVADDYIAYFESRIPGLKRWVLSRCREEGLSIKGLTDDQKQYYAEEYFELNSQLQPNQLPPDPLLKTYYAMGCYFAKLVPNAYRDELSMNYGVVAVYENPLPPYLRRLSPIRKLIAAGINLVAHSHFLTRRVF